ncbi:UNVERIFIED_CONTAM: hypothetical protein GTU68_001164 [Idotea baltica]|nr:hypothetical protein [Idotea baltica]
MNGYEALELVENENPFDIVLLDVMMPRMSGYEVCRRLREKFLPSELPIIMVTAKDLVADMVEGLDTGANDYIAKPFVKDEFLARIKTHLNLHRINRVTQQFVPTEFIRTLGKDNLTEVKRGDQVEQNVTVFFSDIRNYTGMAEQMTPGDNFSFVNSYSERMGPIIGQNKGFVNQYLGDGIMAIFQHEPQDSLQAAIDTQAEIRVYNNYRDKQGRAPIEVGIGMHTGRLIMGIIGDEHRMEAATISDTVNTAARMEGLTKTFGAKVLISEETYSQIPEDHSFNFRYLGQVQVKGRKQALGIYECLDGWQEDIRARKIETVSDFSEGLAAYYEQDFDIAQKSFYQLVGKNPDDKAAQLYLKRSLDFLIKGAPKGWTGVEMMQGK